MSSLSQSQAYHWAVKQPGRVEEEKLFVDHPNYSYYYCFNKLKCRWLEAELYIKPHPYWALCYALDIIGRTKSAVEWLRPLISNDFVGVMNTFCVGMQRPLFLGLQECIIQERPDLIDRIQELDPYLEKKYKNELALSGIEI